MHPTTINEKEGGDLITIYELMNNLERTDRKYLILRRKGEARYLRGQKKNSKRNLLERYKKVQFSQRNIDTWSGMKEKVIMAKNVHQLKEKLKKYRYGYRTKGVYM